jgi:hypothetical protein
MTNFKFKARDKVDKSYIRISSLNFDDSGLVQVSGFTKSGKLIHLAISQVDLKITSDDMKSLRERLDKGRDYLMTANPYEYTYADLLEVFGFDGNGHDKI